MKKLISAVAVILIACASSFAQQVRPREEYRASINKSFYGLYNECTQTWVVQPKYSSAKYIGSYEGVHYYALKNDDNLWGFMTSDDYSRMKVGHKFSDFYDSSSRFTLAGGLPVVPVKRGSDWGLIELYTASCYFLVPTEYSNFMITGVGVDFQEWSGGWKKLYDSDTKARFDKRVAADKKKEEQRRKDEEDARRREQERQARLKKEKELASFTSYAQNYVTPLINEWQKKGEFEKLADYQSRVTGERRLEKIAEFSKEAERLFISEHSKLDHTKNMTLDMYDSENEVFSIISEKFGQLLLPVPISEGQSFKDNFATVVKSDAEYFIQNDQIALSSLTFTNSATGKSYKYSNVAGLNYSRYEINADSFNFESIRINSTTTTTVRSMTKPTCEILSPRMGESYTTGTITIRYRIRVGEGLTYKLHVSVNGEDVEPIFPTGETKGARVATGEELEIRVPRKTDELCNIAMWVVDSEGTLGEPQKLRLTYTGDKPKPALHLFAVGVSDYPAKDLTSLSYASKDAKDFINTITTSNTDIYSNVTTSLLTDKAATRSGVLSGLKKLVSEADQGDVVMVYFSGHGVPDGDQFFYMTHDASAQECYNGVDFQAIRSPLKALTEEKKCHVILFMDTCYSGAMFGMKSNTKEFSMTVPGLVGFYSSTSGQQSAEIDKLQNGAFTHAILAGLKGAAKNSEGEITINELETFIKRKVAEDTMGKQNPIVENLLGDAVLFKVK